ncbi:chromosome partitioning protein [Naumannella sp. ID2617S]|nr:chromosome partitioning protein [Naumannella sp. ID2617S]
MPEKTTEFGRRSWGPEDESELTVDDPTEDSDAASARAHRAARAAEEESRENRQQADTPVDEQARPQEPASQRSEQESAPQQSPRQAQQEPAQHQSATEQPDGPQTRAPRQPAALENQERTPGNRPEPRSQKRAARTGAETRRPREETGNRYSAGDLIAQLTPAAQPRAKAGWRSRLRLGPTQRELDENRDTEVTKTVFTRPVTIMVANPKGGSGKTPTALLLAAAFGLARGGGVVAWDNNELRGTMPDRSESPHRRNVRDLLGAMDRLSRSDAHFTDLAHFLNHQASGTFYTLGSAQTADRVISDEDFDLVHNVFARFFQVIVVDTGNNEAAPNWVSAAEVADCLVVPTKWRSDSLIPAARMLETLQDSNPELLRRTVIAATNGPADVQAKVKANGASWFGSAHPIVELPTDPHLAEGGVIDHAKLRPATRRAALHLAAEVARRLVDTDLD